MIKKICLSAIIIIGLISCNSVVKASNVYGRPKTPALNDIYTEGFYNFDINGRSTLAVRLVEDTPTTIMVLNKEQNLLAITNMPFDYAFELTNITSDNIIGIVGDGDVAISFIPID